MLKKTLLNASLCLLTAGFISQNVMALAPALDPNQAAYAVGTDNSAIMGQGINVHYYVCCKPQSSHRVEIHPPMWYNFDATTQGCPSSYSLSHECTPNSAYDFNPGAQPPHHMPKDAYTYSNAGFAPNSLPCNLQAPASTKH